MVDLAAEPLELPEWAGLVVVPNAYGETFARVARPALLDCRDAHLAGPPDPLARGVLWATRSTRAPARSSATSPCARHLPREPPPAW